jgi:hypothetical protein
VSQKDASFRCGLWFTTKHIIPASPDASTRR